MRTSHSNPHRAEQVNTPPHCSFIAVPSHCICILFFGDPLLIHCFSFPCWARCSLCGLSFAQDPVFTENQQHLYHSLSSVLHPFIKTLISEVKSKVEQKNKIWERTSSVPLGYHYSTTISKTSRKQRADAYLWSTTIVPLFSMKTPIRKLIEIINILISFKSYRSQN